MTEKNLKKRYVLAVFTVAVQDFYIFTKIRGCGCLQKYVNSVTARRHSKFQKMELF
jgi:hypothetical protein